MTVLDVRDVTKTFLVRADGLGRRTAELRAVDGVSFSVGAGETLGLVGESGCGKSTLGRTVVRLIEPTTGEVLVNGEARSADDPALRREVQIVFQDPYTSLPPKMRVRQILAEPLVIHGLCPPSDIEHRVEELLASVRLKPDHAGAFPHQLSGGQRQRVSIARALAVEPDLIVADEAVSALDVSVQAQILNLLLDLQREHSLAFLFISHDLGVVRYMSDRVAVMYLGRIVELGPADDVADDPLHPYSAALLAAVPTLTGTRSAVGIVAEPPNPAAPPPGCAFHPRCPMARAVCREEVPGLLEWKPSRWSACHFALEVASRTPGPTGGDE